MDCDNCARMLFVDNCVQLCCTPCTEARVRRGYIPPPVGWKLYVPPYTKAQQVYHRPDTAYEDGVVVCHDICGPYVYMDSDRWRIIRKHDASLNIPRVQPTPRLRCCRIIDHSVEQNLCRWVVGATGASKVYHKDGDVYNNREDNLRVVTKHT